LRKKLGFRAGFWVAQRFIAAVAAFVVRLALQFAEKFQ
jgi:hypothetical protein